MKLSTRRVKRLGKTRPNAKLRKAGAVQFTALQDFLTEGETNVVVLDLTGRPKPVTAHVIAGSVDEVQQARKARLSKLEKAIREAVELYDIDKEVTKVAFILAEGEQVPFEVKNQLDVQKRTEKFIKSKAK
jgi:hypothetical protein